MMGGAWAGSQEPWVLFFWLRHVACEILVPRPGIKPGRLAVEAQSPNHWSALEFPGALPGF